MPQALIPIIAAAGAGLGGAAGAFLIMNAAAIASVTVTLGLVGANMALARRQQRRAAAQQRAAYNASLKDREVMIRSAIAPRRVVLGRDRISGPVIYAQSTGTKGEFLHLVIALAHGQSDAIEEVWFNDVLLPAPDGSGYINSGEFASNVVTSRNTEVTTAGTTLTLPQVASKVTSVSYVGTYVDLDGQRTSTLLTGWTHTPPSATVSGVVAGTYWVNYETTVSTPLVRIKKHLGAAGQVADADLVAESGGKWTAAHVGAGVTYLYVRLEYNQDVWGQIGIPNISAVVRGALPFDPRTGLSPWTDNAALLAAHWLRHPLGLAADSADVPSSELLAEANICDETIELDAGGTLTQPRYVFNGSFATDESPRDVLEDILTSMAGTAIWVQGRWLLRAGAYRTPAATLNEDALAGTSVSIVPRASRSELFNAVRVTHRDGTQAWAEVQAPLVTNAGYEAEDGGRQLVRSISLPGEMDTWRAQRLGKIMLERARQSVTVQLSTNLKGYNLLPTDNVPLSLARYGWSGKVFEVRQRTYDPMGALQYTLVETAAGVWAWNYGEATVGDLAPNTTLPNPYSKPAALTGLAVDAGPSYILRGPGGQLTARALVVWDATTDVFVLSGGRIDVQWKRTSAAEWQATPRVDGDQTQTILSPMPDGDAILVRVRAVNASGRASAWTTEAENVVRTALYAKQSLIDATWWRPDADWEWTRYQSQPTECSIVWGSGPHSESQALFKAIKSGTSGVGNDGGWSAGTLATTPKNAFAVDTSKTYRFALPIMRLSGSGGLRWGVGGSVCDLNTSTPAAAPYFWAGALPAPNRWYLQVGYVYPAGSTGLTNAGAGLYDLFTGELVDAGTNYCWAADATECSTLGQQHSATAAATVQWAPPQVDVMDGAPTGRITFIGDKQIITNYLADRSVTSGLIEDSSQVVGSSGSPGASTRVATVWGPTITTEDGDELDITVAGLLAETFWSQAAIAYVELWLTHAPTFGGTQTEFGTRRKFMSPVDVYTNTTWFSLDMQGQITPGAVTRDYVLRVSITYRDAAGASKLCAKDFTADAQWRVVRRKR